MGLTDEQMFYQVMRRTEARGTIAKGMDRKGEIRRMR
jgi:hypothetical protein